MLTSGCKKNKKVILVGGSAISYFTTVRRHLQIWLLDGRICQGSVLSVWSKLNSYKVWWVALMNCRAIVRAPVLWSSNLAFHHFYHNDLTTMFFFYPAYPQSCFNKVGHLLLCKLSKRGWESQIFYSYFVMSQLYETKIP